MTFHTPFTHFLAHIYFCSLFYNVPRALEEYLKYLFRDDHDTIAFPLHLEQAWLSAFTAVGSNISLFWLTVGAAFLNGSGSRTS